ADDIANFTGELRIIAELEAFHPVWLQFVLLPDSLHGRRADLLARRHASNAPVCGVLRCRVNRRFDDGSLTFFRYLLRPSAPWPILQYSGNSIASESSAPQQHCGKRSFQIARQ